MRVLITGGSGLVGSALLELLGTRGDIELHAASRIPPALKARFTHHTIDLTEPASMDALASLAPDIVIHAAAETNVDLCEDQPDRARTIHDDATRRLIERFPHAKFVYLSTDYVFDGRDGPYSETDRPDPLGVYAKTKYVGESRLRPRDLIIRTTVVWGQHPRRNFANWLVGELEQGRPVRVVDDQIGSPTYAKHLAQAIAHLMTERAGLYNVVGPETMSRYEFSCRLARQLGYDEKPITPVRSSELKQRAPRPMRAGLRIDKLLSTGFIMPPLSEAAEDFWMELRGIRAVHHRNIPTKDTAGKPNGHVRELVSPRDGFELKEDAQVYLTVAEPGTVKGWHTHRRKTGHFSVVSGAAKLVLSDGRKFKEFILTGTAPALTVRIPPGVKAAFAALGDAPCSIINYSSPDYDPADTEEMETEPVETYPYRWS